MVLFELIFEQVGQRWEIERIMTWTYAMKMMTKRLRFERHNQVDSKKTLLERLNGDLKRW